MLMRMSFSKKFFCCAGLFLFVVVLGLIGGWAQAPVGAGIGTAGADGDSVGGGAASAHRR